MKCLDNNQNSQRTLTNGNNNASRWANECFIIFDCGVQGDLLRQQIMVKKNECY